MRHRANRRRVSHLTLCGQKNTTWKDSSTYFSDYIFLLVFKLKNKVHSFNAGTISKINCLSSFWMWRITAACSYSPGDVWHIILWKKVKAAIVSIHKWISFWIDNTSGGPRFPRLTLITGAHRRQFPLAPNLSSGGVARSRRRPGARAGRGAPPLRHAAPLTVRAARRRHATTQALRPAMHTLHSAAPR